MSMWKFNVKSLPLAPMGVNILYVSVFCGFKGMGINYTNKLRRIAVFLHVLKFDKNEGRFKKINLMKQIKY